MKLTTAQLDRAAGVLVATAVGDALGAGYEFGPALSSSTPVTMKGGGPFGFAPAEWTDDTSMAIVISNAMLDALDSGRLPVGRGTFSSMVNGWQAWAAESKDVGAQTSSVLHRASRSMDRGQNPAEAAFNAARAHHEATGRSAGNGSLMRTAPLALAFLDSAEGLWDAAERISSLTHFEDDAAEACQLWTAAIRHAILTGVLDVRIGLPWLRPGRGELWLSRIEVAEASQPRDFKNNGWVVEAFQGAWSAIFHAVTSAGAVRPSSLRVALENAVRGGNDTDTVAAIAGGLIGAAAGYSAIPAEWRRKLHGWGANGVRELLAISLELVAGARNLDSWPRADDVDYSGYPGIGTVVQHPDDAGVWIGGSAQLPYLGYRVPEATGLPAALGEVSAVVSLCRVGAQEAPHIETENHLSFWLIDTSIPEENAHLEFVLRDAAAAVAAFRAEGRIVYLHCVQSESRTPTVAALYGELVGGDVMASLERVVRALPNAHPNHAFLKVLERHDAAQ